MVAGIERAFVFQDGRINIRVERGVRVTCILGDVFPAVPASVSLLCLLLFSRKIYALVKNEVTPRRTTTKEEEGDETSEHDVDLESEISKASMSGTDNSETSERQGGREEDRNTNGG